MTASHMMCFKPFAFWWTVLQLVVLEMKILSTVFLKPDNEKVYYPNSVLATKPISNWYRSPEMKDFLDFAIHISTSTEQIDKLKQMIAG
jgi:small-conductance mechanosensitive channel